MIRGFWTARTGLNAQQQRLDTVANNMANVNTTAFKPMRTSFKDLIYQNINRPDAQDTAMTGAGVKVNSNDILMTQGPLTATAREMDMALLVKGDFFALENTNGDILYTRSGNFYMHLEDNTTAFLVDGDGNRVLDADGSQIELAFVDGRFVFNPADVGVYRFPNAYGLESAGSNTYLESANSGAPEPVMYPEYTVGYLEGSGVDIAQEMVNMIEAQRAFTLNARVSQTADEVEQEINNLR